MRILILSCLLCFAVSSVNGKDVEQKQDTTKTKPDSIPFTPLIPDSLTDKELEEYFHPERDPEFRKRYGIIPAPSVEPKGFVYEVDPTVDLKMIYPLRTRQKIMWQKKMKEKELEFKLKPKP